MIQEASQGVNWLEYGAVLVAVATVTGSILVALIGRWRSPHQTVAISTDAVEKLTRSVSILTADLDEVQTQRREDRIQFRADMEASQEQFEKDIEALKKELEAYYNARIVEEISALRKHYEDKMARQEQSHRDRVNTLKVRIKELENRVNGNGAVK